MDEKAPPSFFVSLQSPDRPLLIPCAERARPLFVIYHTHLEKNGAACCSAVRARVCWCAGATFDVSFRVHSSSSSPSQGCEYPSMSSFRVRVQWVRRTRTRIRVRVYRPRRTRTRNSNSVVALAAAVTVPLLQQRFNDDDMATQGKHEGTHFEDKSVVITEGKMFNKTIMHGKIIMHGKNTRVDSV